MKICIFHYFDLEAFVFSFFIACVTKILGQWTAHGWH